MSNLYVSPKPTLPVYALAIFVVITFAITWGVVGGYIIYPDAAVAAFGELGFGHPFYFLATWAPGIAAILLVIVFGGRAGLRAFLGRLLLWRCDPVWWLLILIGIPLVFVLGSLIKGGPLLVPFPPEGAGPLVALMVMMLFLGPMEEFGWRGVAQPLLQRYMAPIWAGTIIGVVWGIWHLPAFYMSGLVFAEWRFLPFFIGNITLAVLVTPIFNNARGSLALPMLFHWQLINPFWPDAQPYDTWILLAVTMVVVWWKRDVMFLRAAGVTDVIPK